MKLFEPAAIVGMVSIPGIPLRSEISPYGVRRQSERLPEVDADVARRAVVVPVQEPEAYVEHGAPAERVGVGSTAWVVMKCSGEYGSPWSWPLP